MFLQLRAADPQPLLLFRRRLLLRGCGGPQFHRTDAQIGARSEGVIGFPAFLVGLRSIGGGFAVRGLYDHREARARGPRCAAPAGPPWHPITEGLFWGPWGCLRSAER